MMKPTAKATTEVHDTRYAGDSCAAPENEEETSVMMPDSQPR
jgi:hypothetical protein